MKADEKLNIHLGEQDILGSIKDSLESESYNYASEKPKAMF